MCGASAAALCPALGPLRVSMKSDTASKLPRIEELKLSSS